MSRTTQPPDNFWSAHILQPAAAQEAARRTEAESAAHAAAALDTAVKTGMPAFVASMTAEAAAALDAIHAIAGPSAARISAIVAPAGEEIGFALVALPSRDFLQVTLARQSPATIVVATDLAGSRGRRHHRIATDEDGRLVVDLDGEALAPSEMVRRIAAPWVVRAGGAL